MQGLDDRLQRFNVIHNPFLHPFFRGFGPFSFSLSERRLLSFYRLNGENGAQAAQTNG